MLQDLLINPRFALAVGLSLGLLISAGILPWMWRNRYLIGGWTVGGSLMLLLLAGILTQCNYETSVQDPASREVGVIVDTNRPDVTTPHLVQMPNGQRFMTNLGGTAIVGDSVAVYKLVPRWWGEPSRRTYKRIRPSR